MEQNQFKCSGDCLKCTPVQRQYCAAQKAYDNQHLLLDIQEKLAAIQDNEAHVFNPAIASDTPCTSAASSPSTSAAFSQQPSPATTPTASAAGPDTSQKGSGA